MTTIAVLGLGAMGLPMATNLAKKFTVRGYDINPERLSLAASKGVETFTSATSTVAGADYVLLAVRNQEQLRDVLFGEEGIASAMPHGACVILTSTVGVDVAQQAAHDLKGYGLHMIDAPISGGPARAGNGDLLVVVGASRKDYDAAKEVLDTMASTLVFVGEEVGKGQALKTINQLLAGVHIAVGAEALALARKLGLDMGASLQALMGGAAASFMFGDRGPRMIDGYGEGIEAEDVDVCSRMDIFVKDMGIVAETARRVHAAIPLAATAQQLYVIGEQAGLGACDDSQVIHVLDPH